MVYVKRCGGEGFGVLVRLFAVLQVLSERMQVPTALVCLSVAMLATITQGAASNAQVLIYYYVQPTDS